jgi:two-component system OmpR family sensor kinase
MAGPRTGRIRRPWTLYWRLAVGFLAVTVVGVAIADVVSVAALSRRLSDRVDQQITSARTYVQPLVAAGHHLWAEGTPPNGVVMVLDRNGQVLEQAAGVQARATPLALSLETLNTIAAAGRPVAVESTPYRVTVGKLPDGGFLVVAQIANERAAAVRSLVEIEAIASVPLIVMVVLGTVWFTRRTLAPISQMTQTARQITQSDMSHRVDPPQSPFEAVCLAEAFNGMLQRIEVEFTRRREAEQQLRDFVAGASHELRTPLTAISGYVQLVRFGAADEPATLDRVMRRVEQETWRMTGMVDELLLLARLDQGRPLEREPVDLAELCADTVADMGVLAPDRVLRLTVEPAEHSVEGDPNRLRQVVTNLLGNCLVHTSADVPVEMRLTRDGACQVLDVVDEGPGVPEELRERVFERFFRGPGASAGTGTGLGLSIVAAIVAAHGGSVRIEPSERGTWVRVRLPVRPESAPGCDRAVTLIHL